MLTPEDQAIANAFVNGRPRTQIAQDMHISPNMVNYRLNKPTVKEEIARRLEQLGSRMINFKLRAFDGAEGALEKLIFINQATTTPIEIQRLSSMDLIKVAGAMPRKRIIVEGTVNHGIDDDTKDFITEVMKEAEILDGTP